MTRPTIYTDELAEKICDLLAEGKSMVKACEALGVCRRTVNLWLKKNPEFANMTVEARESHSDDIVDRILEIAVDEGMDFNTRRLLIDSIKWVAGKQRPKKYNDKVMHTGPDGDGPVQVVIQKFTDGDIGE